MPDREPAATMTVEQAGALLGISRRAAYRAAAAGHIPTIRLGAASSSPPPASTTCSASPTPTVLRAAPSRRWRPTVARLPTPDAPGRADVGSRYYVVSWADHHPRDKGDRQATREYGSASSKQAAIRLAERVLPPGRRFLPEQATAAALLDRLLHHAIVVTTEGESFRMREAKTRTTRRKKAS